MFTKDELQIFLLDMNITINKAAPLTPSPSYLALRDKVEYLVDNYSEITAPKMDRYVCPKCIEEWAACECIKMECYEHE